MNDSRERDQAVERLLRQSPPRSGGAAGACLDAETLAAWVDGGLHGAALDMAQSHVADCARCQTMVGALARIDSRVPPIPSARGARRWLAWLVPLAAAAATVAIWVAVPRDTSPPHPQASNVQELSVPSKPSDESKGAALNERDQARPLARDENKDTGSAGGKTEAVDRRESPRERAELRKEAGQLEAGRAQAPPGPPAAPASAAPAAAPPGFGDKVAGLRRLDDRVAQSAATDAVSPDQSVRWRIAGSGLERSMNGGLLWEAVPTGVAAELTAVAAPSASVCWVVGRRGVVLLSTDGRTWHRVPIPDMTDVSTVQARDASSASVTTADGRTFSTTDGGINWVRRPLQEF